MSHVRVWDVRQRWLWPNLAYLLRLHGTERVERYGGVDPGKGVDNDFAAVLIREYDATGRIESENTKTLPMVSAEWHAVGVDAANRQTIVHTVQSDEFTLHLGGSGEPSGGRAGIWLIYADFLGAKVPPAWPREAEYAGGVLAFCEAQWSVKTNGKPEIRIAPMAPRQATSFDWERWTLRTLASPDSTSTAKLGNRTAVSHTLRMEDLQAIFTTDLFRTNPALAMAQLSNTPSGRRLSAELEQMRNRHEDRFRKRTDHVALLTACRSVIQKRSEYARDPKWHGGDPPNQKTSLISPADKKLPEVLRSLGATSLIVRDDLMIIGMGGGGRHYGLIAFAAGVDDSANTPVNERLIDGLWLYSE